MRRAIKRWWVRIGEARRRRAWVRTSAGRPVDVVVSHAEVNRRHGTGVLTQLLFGAMPDLVSVRSHDDHDARQAFGAWSVRIAQPRAARAAAARRVQRIFRGVPVRRVVAIPYYPDDAWNALSLQELSGAPLCTYVMDDQNLEADGIPDGLLTELLSRSALRLAISEELRDAYQARFGVPFAFLPPVVDPGLVLRGGAAAPPAAPERRRGVMIGNVWGPGWLARLRQVVRDAGVEIDWYSNTAPAARAPEAEALATAGIRPRGALPERELAAVLRRAAFAVLPTGTLDAGDDHRAIARLSLPSKLVFTLAVANLPTLVVGHPDTAAARFVTRTGTGVVAPYRADALAAAVEAILQPEAQARLRARAAALAPAFSADGAGEWILRSLAAGAPVDDRWERLCAARRITA